VVGPCRVRRPGLGGGSDFLRQPHAKCARDGRNVREVPTIEFGQERGLIAVARINRDVPERNAPGPCPVDQHQREVQLGLEAHVRRHMAAFAARSVIGPALGQIELPAHGPVQGIAPRGLVGRCSAVTVT